MSSGKAVEGPARAVVLEIPVETLRGKPGIKIFPDMPNLPVLAGVDPDVLHVVVLPRLRGGVRRCLGDRNTAIDPDVVDGEAERPSTEQPPHGRGAELVGHLLPTLPEAIWNAGRHLPLDIGR